MRGIVLPVPSMKKLKLHFIIILPFNLVLAGDQWWLRTSGGRFRFARAITYLLRHRFGSFVKENNLNPHKKDW